MINPENPIVILVDNKRRDLPGIALIAHHIRSMGVECHLEPLESFRAALGAYRPGMIVFNHVFASQLADWTERLADVGVLTAVLSNEGMYLRDDDLEFNSGRHHRNAHIDNFFCWNRVHRDGLRKAGVFDKAQIDIVGVPRFDYYFEPWSQLLDKPTRREGGRPRILACTNFVLSRFWELPKEYADRFFEAWVTRMPRYVDYWGAVESHWKGQRRFLEYIKPLIESGKYDVVLRPHPSESRAVYDDWLKTLTDTERARVEYDTRSDISAQILSCDLEISGESCTTAVEAWIAHKPTVELVFDHHVIHHSAERSAGNVHCDDPAKIVGIVDEQLANPSQPHLQQIRKTYLEKWCATPDGNACRRVAEIAVAAVKAKKPADWSKLTFVDRRRALKLRATRAIGHAYHFSPLLPLKSLLFKKKYTIRKFTYDKSIQPQDVSAALKRIENADVGRLGRGG